MKNVITAFCIILLMLIGTAVSSVGINRFADKTALLIQKGEYQAALDCFDENRDYISLVVNGDLLRSLHEGLSALAGGDESVKDTVLFACREMSCREKLSLSALF